MISKKTFLSAILSLLFIQTPSMHGITIFGYNLDVTSRLSALYSTIQNYMWNPWSGPIHEERNADAAPVLVQCAVDNFPQLCDNLVGYHILKTILEYYSDAAQAFVQPTIDNFSRMCNNKYGWLIIKTIFDHHPDATQALAKQMENDPRFFYPFNDLVEHKTQTKQHLRVHLLKKYKELSSQGKTNYQDHPDLQAMTKQIIDREHKEQQKGRYTFVHAHQWDYHFYQELYTDLWSIMHEQPNNYRFVRYEYPIKPSTEAFFTYIEQEQRAREELMNGSVKQFYIFFGHQNHLLFMNYALFVNPGFSNSGYYIRANKSYAPKSIDCSSFIKELQIDQYLIQEELEHLENQLTELHAEHASVSKYGAALLLSFTPELMAECVYPCQGYGEKRMVQIEGIGETSDPQIILDTLRTAPEKIVNSDQVEFACILSHDAALIPHNGLDIYEFNAADQDKLAAWRAKKDKLMAWIKERVNKRRQMLTEQAAAKHMRARL